MLELLLRSIRLGCDAAADPLAIGDAFLAFEMSPTERALR